MQSIRDLKWDSINKLKKQTNPWLGRQTLRTREQLKSSHPVRHLPLLWIHNPKPSPKVRLVHVLEIMQMQLHRVQCGAIYPAKSSASICYSLYYPHDLCPSPHTYLFFKKEWSCSPLGWWTTYAYICYISISWVLSYMLLPVPLLVFGSAPQTYIIRLAKINQPNRFRNILHHQRIFAKASKSPTSKTSIRIKLKERERGANILAQYKFFHQDSLLCPTGFFILLIILHNSQYFLFAAPVPELWISFLF